MRKDTEQLGEDRDLIDRCRRGDREALQCVFTVHAPYLERLLARVAGPDLAEDLLQTTLIAAIDAFPRFRGEAQVRTWLSRIAVRTAQHSLRRAERRRRAPGDPVDDLRVASDGPGPDQRSEHRKQLERLEHHLDAIGGDKRMAFVLHVMDGHPMDEVAALMDATVSATKSRVFWARKELLARAGRDPVLRELLPAHEARP